MRRFCRGWRANASSSLLLICVALAATLLAVDARAQEEERGRFEPEFFEIFGFVELEGAGFFEDPAFPGQQEHDVSFALEPTILAEWLSGDLALTITPFLRVDAADDRRTHGDFREAKIDWRIGDWALTFGADFVFWGRTEAQQLVDIINTVDGVEDIDEEDKLGQPMVRVTRFTEIGAFSAFYMPYFRERTFAGVDGRLRAGIPVNVGDEVFLNGGDEFSPSFALRWAHVIGDFDFGLHGFYGVSRDPALEPFQFDPVTGAPTALRPVYDNITQFGLDGQYTTGPALWKVETIGRFKQLDRILERQDYWAITGGLEYTFFNLGETSYDLGLIVEGSYDTRGDAALTPFNEDVTGGARLTLNDEADTAFLATAAVDTESGGAIIRVEAERRVFGGWKAEIEGNAFVAVDDSDIEASLSDDSFLRLKLSYFF